MYAYNMTAGHYTGNRTVHKKCVARGLHSPSAITVISPQTLLVCLVVHLSVDLPVRRQVYQDIGRSVVLPVYLNPRTVRLCICLCVRLPDFPSVLQTPHIITTYHHTTDRAHSTHVFVCPILASTPAHDIDDTIQQ